MVSDLSDWFLTKLHTKSSWLLFYGSQCRCILCVNLAFSDTFTFQQDRALSQQAPEIVELLSHMMPDFISPDQWPSNNPDLNPADYRSLSAMKQNVYKQRSTTYENTSSKLGITLNRGFLLLTVRLLSGTTIWDHMYVSVPGTLNTCCKMNAHICDLSEHFIHCQCNLMHLIANL